MADKKKAVETKKVVKKDKKPSSKKHIFARIVTFLKGMKSELRKVTWPSLRQVTKNTSIVILIVVGSGVFIGLADLLFKTLVGLLAI